MRIFLCHASEQHELAARLATALRAQDHSVFLDRDDLPAGDSFDDRIRRAVKESRLFIFLVSPESVANSSYTLSELKFARMKWPNPGIHVLPVMAVNTPFDKIPAYLSALTVLRPEGNLIAEVLAETDRLRGYYKSSLLVASIVAPILFLIAIVLFLVFTKNGTIQGNWQANGSGNSTNFGGPPYATWNVALSDISIRIELEDNGHVINSSAKALMTERILNADFAVIPANVHKFAMAGYSFDKSNISVMFSGLVENRPPSIANFAGRFENECILPFINRFMRSCTVLSGDLFVHRKEGLDSRLEWTVAIPLILSRISPE